MSEIQLQRQRRQGVIVSTIHCRIFLFRAPLSATHLTSPHLRPFPLTFCKRRIEWHCALKAPASSAIQAFLISRQAKREIINRLCDRSDAMRRLLVQRQNKAGRFLFDAVSDSDFVLLISHFPSQSVIICNNNCKYALATSTSERTMKTDLKRADFLVDVLLSHSLSFSLSVLCRDSSFFLSFILALYRPVVRSTRNFLFRSN